MREDDLLEGNPESKAIEVLENGGRVCVLVAGQMYMSWESGDEESQRIGRRQLHSDINDNYTST